MELGRFRIGLRVSNVEAAAARFCGLGFEEIGSVPGPDGTSVMILLQRQGAMLILDALSGMPFASTDREERVQQGPRGLGVAVGLGVDDLSAAYTWCQEQGFQITSEPRREPFGDEVFECIDPDGYLWEISQPSVGDGVPDDPLKSTRDTWFGDSPPERSRDRDSLSTGPTAVRTGAPGLGQPGWGAG